jgi:hypothetical protein
MKHVLNIGTCVGKKLCTSNRNSPVEFVDTVLAVKHFRQRFVVYMVSCF